MGTNYGQNCMVGIRLERDDLKKVISPEEYRDEPRYDTRTGKQIKTERIIVKNEVFVYEVFGKEYDDLYEVEIDGLVCRSNFDPDKRYGFFIGLDIGEDLDCGRVELLQGSLSLAEIAEKAKIG